MPKVFTVAEIRELDADTIVNSFRGKVTKIYDRKSGESDKGPWSFQDIYLKDKAGDEIKATLKGRDAFEKSWLNKEIIVLAHKSEKGWSSVYANDNEYKDKVTRILLITPKATITKGGVAPAEESEAEPSDNDGGNVESEETAEAETHENESSDGDLGPVTHKSSAVDAAKDFLMQRANFEVLVHRAVQFAGAMCEEVSSIPFTPEQFLAAKGRFYIDGAHKGLVDQMPVKPLFALKPKADEVDPDGIDPSAGEEETPRKKAASKKR